MRKTKIQVEVESRRIILDGENAIRRALHKLEQGVEAFIRAERSVAAGKDRIVEIRNAVKKMRV